jgi:CRP-like cAMP-binding protein
MGDAMYVIVHGRIDISKQVMAGFDKSLTVLEDGDYFGEMSLLLNANRSATATALEETTLVKLGLAEFKRLLRESPEVGMTMLRQLAERLSKTNRESILLALELALAEQRPPDYSSHAVTTGQIIVAIGSFELQDISDVLQRTQELRWASQTKVLANLLKPGQGEDALIYIIQTDEYREIMKLTSCFKHLVRWTISPAVTTNDALVETFE